jgi:chromosome segregation ATPase
LQNTIGRAGQLEQRLHTHIEANNRLSAQLQYTENTIQELESKMHVPAEVWDTLNDRIKGLTETLALETAKRTELQQELTAAVAEISELQSKMHVPTETWDALNAKIRTLTRQLTATQHTVTQQEQTLTDLHDQQQATLKQNERLERRLRIAQTQIAQLATQLEQVEHLPGKNNKKTIQG